MCFAGCTNLDILHALEMPRTALTRTPILSPADVARHRTKRIVYPSMSYSGGTAKKYRGNYDSVEYHEYTPFIRLARFRYGREKLCLWERKGSDGWWHTSIGLDLTQLPLYREHEVHAAKAFDDEVILCESESSVDALVGAGLIATTWAGGASHVPLATLTKALQGSQVLWVPDNDQAGLRCSRRVEPVLKEVCLRVRTILPPEGEDARDVLLSLGAQAFR